MRCTCGRVRRQAITPKSSEFSRDDSVMFSAMPSATTETGYMPSTLQPIQYTVERGPGTLEMTTFVAGSTEPRPSMAGAMAGVAVTLVTGDPWTGILAGIGAGMALSLLFGLAVVVLRADQILAGLAAVALGAGLSGLIGRDYAHETVAGIDKLPVPGLADLPVAGPVLFSQDPIAYFAVVLAIAVWWLLMRTRFGLRLRAVGEDPATADVAGVDVQMMQLGAVLFSGAACGLAGAYLSVVASQVWVENMVVGRGWVAIGLVIFARWNPLRAILGALVFGGADALLPRLLATGADVPSYIMMMLPYALTIAVMAVPALLNKGRGAEPQNLGRPYLRQDRR